MFCLALQALKFNHVCVLQAITKCLKVDQKKQDGEETDEQVLEKEPLMPPLFRAAFHVAKKNRVRG